MSNRQIDKSIALQRICMVFRDGNQVKELLDAVWNQPLKIREVLAEMLDGNQNVFEFEKALAV